MLHHLVILFVIIFAIIVYKVVEKMLFHNLDKGVKDLDKSVNAELKKRGIEPIKAEKK